MTPQRYWLLLVPLVSCGVLLPGCGTTPGRASSEHSVELETAVSEVEDAILYYQTFMRSQTRGLPALAKVEFDFQTTTDIGGSANVNLYVLTLGASAQRETVHQITYTYAKLPSTGAGHDETPPALFQELTDTIKTAAQAANAAKTFGNQPLDNLRVKIQYGFRKTLKGGVAFPFEMVTLGINAQYEKNAVQSVTLTFAPR